MQATLPDRLGAALLSSSLQDTGQGFHIWLALVNQTSSNWVIQFASAQQFDFALADDKGNEYWRWSTGRTFDPNPTSVTVMAQGFFVLGPVDLASLPHPKTVGAFVTLSGFLTAEAPLFSARVNVTTTEQ